MDLASLITDTLRTTAGMADAVTQIGAFREAGQQAAQTQADNAQSAAEASNEVTGIELEDKARQEQQMNELHLRMAANPLAAGSFIMAAKDKVAKGWELANAAEQRFHEKESVGFFDNPAQWLINKATVGKDIEDYKHGARMVNSAEAEAAAYSGLLNEGEKQIKALSNVYSAGYIAARKTLQAQQYLKQATDATMAGARFGIEGIHAATSISAQALQLEFSANSAQNQAKSIQMELERLQLQRESGELNNMIKGDKIKSEKVAQDYIDAGFFALNGRHLSDDERSLVTTKLQMKDPRVLQWYDTGLQSSQIGGKPVINLSPYKATDTIATGMVTNWASPSMKLVGDQLVSWRKEWESPAVQNTATYDKTDKNARERAFNAYVQGKVNNPEGIPIFQPMPLRQVTELNKNLSNLPLWKNILGPAAAAGANVDDPNTAFGIITASLAEGKLSYVDAVDYSALMAGAQKAKNMGNNLLAFGIQPPTSVRAQIKLTQDFGNDRVNVVDQMEVARAINKAMGIRATMVPAVGYGTMSEDSRPAKSVNMQMRLPAQP